ncbi:hypothetical protein ACWGLG_20590 [Streptomyces antimycoticus]
MSRKLPSLRPEDLDHVLDLDWALAKATFPDADGLEPNRDLYGVVNAVLAADDRVMVPFGLFGRYLRYRQFREVRTLGDRFTKGLVLREEFEPPPDQAPSEAA